jgi:hypothetical protein
MGQFNQPAPLFQVPIKLTRPEVCAAPPVTGRHFGYKTKKKKSSDSKNIGLFVLD